MGMLTPSSTPPHLPTHRGAADFHGGAAAARVPLLSGHQMPINGGSGSSNEKEDHVVADHHHIHPQNAAGTSFTRTCINGLNALSGVGLLSVPYALAQGGWWSFLLLLLVAVICWYTGRLLQLCMDTDERIKSYPDIGELAFGRKGRLLVSISMYLEIYLVAIEFLILEGDNLAKLFPGASIQLGSFAIEGKQLFVVAIALVILPTTWLQSLGVLAYVSAGGVLASVVVVASVLWSATSGGVGFHERGELLNVQGLPTTLGLYAFCYCGHAVFPTLRNSMKDKSRFSEVLVLCFIVCTVIYGAMAVLGYLMYGSYVQSQITLDLPLGHLSSKIAIYTTLVNPFTKYALMIMPVASALEDRLMIQRNKAGCICIRSLMVLSTLAVALVLPFFGYLMALIGSLLSVVVSMLLPCACYLMIVDKQKGSARSSFKAAERPIIVAIVLFSIVVAAVGTYTSLKQIIHEM